MKLTGHIERWASGVLGAVSLVLVVNLALQFSGVRAGGSRPTVPAPAPAPKGHPQDVPARITDDLARYDPVVRVDLLKELEGRPLPELPRNPFEFEALPTSPASPAQAAAAAAPPPPPVSLKPMGYSEKAGGGNEAYVSDEEQVYVVHEGDTVSGKYKIIKITPSSITVEDVTSHQTVELPIPQ